jgi:AcrR family transcriptional regulator
VSEARSGRGTGRPRVSGSTRERLISLSLKLFNERGPDRVTTAQIAEAASINEGNLYYHFRTKQALVLAIFDRFEAEVDALLERSPGGSADPAVYLAFLRDWFAIVWSYRFLYRDLPALLATAPDLRRRVRDVSARLRAPVETLVGHMREAGLISLPDEELEAVLANVWIVSTYWAVYLDVQEGVRTLRKSHLEWGLGQIASLFRPYLSEAARQWLAAQP